MLLHISSTVAFCCFTVGRLVLAQTDSTIGLPLIVSIHDPNGVDISNQIAVLHHHQEKAQQQKRAIPRRIDQCNNEYPDFEGSSCQTSVSPQRYHIWCAPLRFMYLTLKLYVGDCLPHEVCIDGRRPAGIPFLPGHAAFCVSTLNFVEIATDQLNSLAVLDVAVPNNTAGQAKTMAATAILTGKTNTTSLLAAKMTISAINHGPIQRPLVDGAVVCENCSSVDLPALVAAMQTLQAEVIMEQPEPGNLFLATFVV